jgi:amino acid transporter
VIVLLCGLLNVFSIKTAGWASTVMAAGLITAMAAFIFAGLSGGNWDVQNMVPFFTQGSGGTFGFMSAVPLAMVAYSSIVAAAFMVGEIRNPKKTVPMAMSIAMAVVVGLYLLIMLTTLGLVTATYLLETGMEYIPLYAAVYKALANMPWIPYIISIAAVLALTNNILVMITLLGRTVQAAATSGILPRSLRKETRMGVPLRATVTVTVILALLSSIPDATNFIIGMGTLCSAAVVVIVSLSVLAARKKNPGKSRFKAPGGNVLPVIMMLVILACYIPGMLAGGWQLWVCTLAYFAVGMGVYWMGSRQDRNAVGGTAGDKENTGKL